MDKECVFGNVPVSEPLSNSDFCRCCCYCSSKNYKLALDSASLLLPVKSLSVGLALEVGGVSSQIRAGDIEKKGWNWPTQNWLLIMPPPQEPRRSPEISPDLIWSPRCSAPPRWQSSSRWGSLEGMPAQLADKTSHCENFPRPENMQRLQQLQAHICYCDTGLCNILTCY